MKKTILIVVIALACTAFGFKVLGDKSAAQVNMVDGVYIFVDSKPSASYERLGEVKSAGGLSNQYVDIRDRLINKAKKEYPNANGVIIDFKKGGSDKAQVILIKD